MVFNDTIAAISTPIGEGGIGVIRISGMKAKEIALDILQTPRGSRFKIIDDHRLYYGKVSNPQTGQIIDEVLFFYAKGPHSFTAEDIIEIQAHGGSIGLAEILDVIINHGARLAEPGEFTKRAYLNGRIDLVQAESVIDLIRAKTEKAHQIALAQLSGKATLEINQIEDLLYHILISIEALLDFPEEGIPEPQKNRILEQVVEIEERLKELLTWVDEGRKIREGIMVVIVGRPNVGKSSLLNAFLEEERAIVTEIPGTTRDVIEAQIQFKGIPVRLIDTAGIRETDNIIEQIGIKKTEQYMKEADLVIFILDASQPLSNEDKAIAAKIKDKKVLLVINKTDLPTRIQLEEIDSRLFTHANYLSLYTKQGLEQLKKRIIDLVGLGKLAVDDRPLLSRIRHKQALEQSLTALKNFHYGLQIGLSEDLLAVDLRACLEALGEITGKKVSEEVIHGIFSQFCIGK